MRGWRETAELCRKHGISDAEFYNWKTKCGVLTGSDAERLRALGDKNRRLRTLLAKSMLDASALKDLLGQLTWSVERYVALEKLIADHNFSERMPAG